MAEAAKDTVYIDVDDEITGIIDKVAQSKHNIVAIVLPKRATVLQSIVNMKLLKRSGDTHKKKLVLITSETGLMPLAGAVGLHVAKTLQSKPTIPSAPDVPSNELSVDDDPLEDEEDEDESEELDTSKSIGALASAGKPSSSAQADDTIDMNDEADESSTPESKKDKKSTARDKKLMIPNFEKFRTRIFLIGAGLVVLIVGWYFANFVLPTAKITVITDNVSVNTDVPFITDTKATALDEAKGIIPATLKQVTKTDVEKVTATGQKNAGEKAGGNVSLKLLDCSKDQVTVPSGTGVTNGSLTFITQVDITFNSVKIGNKCQNDNFPSFTTGTLKVVAQNSGDQYNISGGRKFTINGFSNVSGFDSSAMDGGTNKVVTVVSDQDIETAKGKLTDKSKDSAVTELKKQILDAKLFAIDESISSATPAFVASPTVGNEASDVTVTSTTVYSMVGIKRDDLKTLVFNSAKKQIDASKQTLSNDGLDKALFKVNTRPNDTQISVDVQSIVSSGAQQDQDDLKKQITSKKKGDVQQLINARPGVKEVNVSFSPFWVYKTPKNPAKITIVYQQSSDSN